MKSRYILTVFLTLSLVIGSWASAYAVPQLKLGLAAGKADGTARLNLSLADGGTTYYAGVNAKIILPAGVTCSGVSKGNLLSGFHLDYHVSASNTVTVVAYSESGNFSGNGTLLTLDLNAENAASGKHPVVFWTTESFVNSRYALSDVGGNSVLLTPANGILAVGQTDSDGDGLPDALEQAVAGNSTGLSPGDDFDNDGSTNLAEYHNMTDLTDSMSWLALMLGDLSGNQNISLEDAIIALQTLCGISVSGANYGAAINGQNVSLSDAVFVLQATANLRD